MKSTQKNTWKYQPQMPVSKLLEVNEHARELDKNEGHIQRTIRASAIRELTSD